MEVVLLIVMLLGLVAFGVIIYNDVNPLWHSLEEARANIEVVMNKRAQLTQRLVDIASRYMSHEQKVFLQISGDRTRIGRTQIPIGRSGQTPAQAVNFFAGLAASFPDLKADQTYLRLMGDLTVLEGEVQNKYEIYNSHAREYNAKRASLPTLLYAGSLGFTVAKYLEPSLWYANDHLRGVK
jgi:LemA protein